MLIASTEKKCLLTPYQIHLFPSVVFSLFGFQTYSQILADKIMLYQIHLGKKKIIFFFQCIHVLPLLICFIFLNF